MKHLCIRDSLVLILLSVLTFYLTNSFGNDAKPSVCFYYHDNVPFELYQMCDWLVVDPRNKNVYKKERAKLIAYISIGEVSKNSEEYKEINKSWIIGENKDWNTVVLDITNPAYQKFLLKKLSRYKNYDGFFFDTIDSYQSVLKDTDKRERYERALIGFIKSVKEIYPPKKIVLNRGFEIIDKVKDYVDGVVAESLFYGLDLKNGGYREVSEEERKWLLSKLNEVKSYEINVIVIDYLPPKERKKAFQTAKKIEKLGFIPYITNKEINIIGTSFFQIKPRRALILYDKRSCPEIVSCGQHYMAQLILEFYGYIPYMKEINTELPPLDTPLVDKYGAIVVWPGVHLVKNPKKFYNWILTRIKEGNKILFVDDFGFPLTEEYLKPLGINVEPNKANNDNFKIIFKDKHLGFESEPFVDFGDVAIYPKGKKSKPLLILENDKGQKTVPIALTDWGGYGLYGASTYTRFNNTMWVVDPLFFFKKAFKINNYPMPDETTLSGNRILYIHIDGDGFIQRLDYNLKKFSSEVVRDDFIKKYKWPHSVSIIEGEIAPWGAYPKYPHKKLENIARSIFSLPNVEPASHSFSHPFKWEAVLTSIKIKKGYSLIIKGYDHFDINREILGSLKYINTRLAPPNKKARLFFWTGDCNPPWQVLKLCYENGILNLNAGDTGISYKEPFLSLVSPMGVNKKEYFQVYASFQNENYYTEEWKPPYYRYRNVIQAFELTDKKWRFKPINVYYHFYVVSKYASLKSLKDVYEWVKKQETTPIFASDYVKSVFGYRRSVVAYDGKGWLISSKGSLAGLKTDGKIASLKMFGKVYIDLYKSKGVAGYRYIPEKNMTYINIDRSGDYYLVLSYNSVKNLSYIYSFNGFIKKVKKVKNGFIYYLKSYVPAEIKFADSSSCNININNRKDFKIFKIKDLKVYKFKKGGDIKVEILCK
ncbi:MAG: polysaccharide deacetylase [Persephonella sp.]|nr:MAG: polysaccharide deacetylase [Persephonella sp.]